LQAALTSVAFAGLAVALALLWLCVHLSRSRAFRATGRELRPKPTLFAWFASLHSRSS